jgi:anti-sigma-K factor RskA
MTNEHPTELIPGFVLGVLDPEEEERVRGHILQCAICQEELRAFSASLAKVGPDLGAPVPRPHVKQRLLERVMGAQDRPVGVAAPAPMARPWMARPRVLAGAALSLVLLIALLFVGAPQQPAPAPDVAVSESGLVVFATTPGTVAHAIPHTADAAARTTLYTHSGDPRIGMEVANLPPAPHGHTYQLWVASGAGQVSLGTFDPAQDGTVSMLAVAPTSVDQYTDAMVTIEPVGGATTPSEKVVWQISL